MIDFKIDPVKKDLILPIQIIDGAEKTAQALRIRLRTWLADWFLDESHGVPYIGSGTVDGIMKKNPNLAIVESIFRSQILTVNGVQSIERFDLQFDPSTRICSVSFDAKSRDGIIPVRLNVNV